MYLIQFCQAVRRMAAIAVICLLLSLSRVQVAQAQSRSPIIRGASGHYYQVIRFGSGVNQAEAKQYAEQQTYGSLHGYLSSWQTLAEATDVASRFNSRGISLKNLWLAGNSIVYYDYNQLPEYVFYWMNDGTLLTYNYWAPGQPDRHYYLEPAICTWTDDGRFNNLSETGRTGNNGDPLGLMVEYR